MLLFCFGLFITIAGINQDVGGMALFGAAMLAAAVGLMIHAKFATWWHHG